MTKLSLAAAATLIVALGACNAEGGNATSTGAPNVAPVAAPNGGDWSKTVSQTPEGGVLMGNPDAKVKLVEFGSMTCSHCAEFSEAGMPKLVDQYVKAGNVSFEFRNFVRDPLDITMALVARCAGASPTFFTLTDGLFADQKAVFERYQAVPQEQLAALQGMQPAQQFAAMAKFANLQEWAAQRGVPSAKSSQCLANQAEIDRLVQMQSDAVSQYNVPGTPAFVINGKLVENAANWASLEPKIKEALGS
ncbi:DsbA family protein [Sphingomonas sp. GCM10030256]|uniref:DsbA family protein n=1 Tax=Sphingomonas sp. GCM10030256 TaxID=3273427 RepID=UPI003606F2C8